MSYNPAFVESLAHERLSHLRGSTAHPSEATTMERARAESPNGNVPRAVRDGLLTRSIRGAGWMLVDVGLRLATSRATGSGTRLASR